MDRASLNTVQPKSQGLYPKSSQLISSPSFPLQYSHLEEPFSLPSILLWPYTASILLHGALRGSQRSDQHATLRNHGTFNSSPSPPHTSPLLSVSLSLLKAFIFVLRHLLAPNTAAILALVSKRGYSGTPPCQWGSIGEVVQPPKQNAACLGCCSLAIQAAPASFQANWDSGGAVLGATSSAWSTKNRLVKSLHFQELCLYPNHSEKPSSGTPPIILGQNISNQPTAAAGAQFGSAGKRPLSRSTEVSKGWAQRPLWTCWTIKVEEDVLSEAPTDQYSPITGW